MWPIRTPGARWRPDHRVPTRGEHVAARRETERRARELLAAGALDRGNGDVLEPYLAATLAGWRARLRACGGPCRRTEPSRPSAGLAVVAPRTGQAPDEPADDAGAPARSGTGLKALLVAAFAGDIANFSIALSAVGNASVVATLFVVVALAAASLGLAHGAGRALRAERTHPTGRGIDRPRRPAIVAMAGLWLGIGLAAATVRLLSPTSATTSTDPFGSFGAAPVEAGPDPTNLALTGLFLALFLASGAMAAIVGLGADPAADRQRSAHRVVRRERAERRHDERMSAAHAAADERCVAVVDELRSRAMHILQCDLGEPGVTSATTWPTRATA